MGDLLDHPRSATEVRLRHRFGGFDLDVDFTAAAGGITALFGPSGAGKTSIVHALAGLTRPDQGRIVIAGRVVLDTAQRLFVPAERRRAGLVFQDARLFPHMSVEKNLLFGWRRAATKATPDAIDGLIALLGLAPLLKRSPRHLSGGEKSRVALGRALLASPDILLLDEPLAALDAARRDEILPYLERLRDAAGIPIIYVSHAQGEVARLADHVVALEAGRVTASGAAADILTGRHGLGAVLDAVCHGRAADGLDEFRFAGGRLLLPGEATKDRRARLCIAADDILIAREAPGAISANNVLPVTVEAVRRQGLQAQIDLRCGPTKFVAHITTASAERLGLAPGMAVFAVIKSVAVARPYSA